jgi:hypothetical protein
MIGLSKITDGGKIKMLYCPQAPATIHHEKEPSETLKSSLLETEFKPPVWDPSPRHRRPWLRRAFAANRTRPRALDNDGREIGYYSTPDEGARALLELAVAEAV